MPPKTDGAAPTSDVSKLLSQLRVSDGEGALERPAEVIEAFGPSSTWQSRTLLAARLARWFEGRQEHDYRGWADELRRALVDNETQESRTLFATIRLLSTLYALASDHAFRLLFDAELLPPIVQRVSAVQRDDDGWIVGFLFAELLSLASSHAGSRKKLIESTKEADQAAASVEPETVPKIVEIDESDQADHASTSLTSNAITLLAAYVEQAELENPSAEQLLSKVSLLSALALHKLSRFEAQSQQKDIQAVSEGSEQSRAEQEKKRREEDQFLYEISKRHLLLGQARDAIAFTQSSSFGLGESSAQELGKICQASTIEALSYLSLQGTDYKDMIVNDDDMIRAIVRVGIESSQVKDVKTRYNFPSRNDQGSSQSDLSTKSVSFDAPDTALQFGTASLLANLVAYPVAKSKEQLQMDKLRRMANAVPEGDSADDLSAQTAAVDRRIAKVIDAKGVESLVAIALTKSPSQSATAVAVNPSAGARGAVARALVAMTTKQDKMQRGRIIQQGGAKSLLAIANKALSDALSGDAAERTLAIAFAAAQGLAHLLISENPSIVLTQPLESIPSLLFLYLHSDATRLQKFEASLALTNLASLSPDIAQHIVQFTFPQKSLDSRKQDEFVGADRSQSDADASGRKVGIRQVLRERVLLEDNQLSRRASLELLCNLVTVDQVFQDWSGETEDEKRNGEEKSKNGQHLIDGRSTKDLTFLIALCAPVGSGTKAGKDGEKGGESGLKMRLAASGVVATLCGSASTCARLLALGAPTLTKLCRLIVPDLQADLKAQPQIVEITDGQEDVADEWDAETEAELHAQDLDSDPMGSGHARWQLALRGVTCVDCLVQYVVWMGAQGTSDMTRAKREVKDSGAAEAIRSIAFEGARELRKGADVPPAAEREVQKQVVRQALDVLKALNSLGMLERSADYNQF